MKLKLMGYNINHGASIVMLRFSLNGQLVSVPVRLPVTVDTVRNAAREAAGSLLSQSDSINLLQSLLLTTFDIEELELQ